MSYVTGHGRKARETYPEAPRAAGGSPEIIQRGYAQPVGTFTLAAVTPFAAVIPRNVGVDPLEVVLLGVTPGNVIEVDYTLALENTDEVATAFNAIVVVSFAASPNFPADFFAVDNSLTNMQPTPGIGFFGLSRNLTAFEAGGTQVTVRLAYDDNDGGAFAIGGTGIFPQFPGSTLKVTEIAASAVIMAGLSPLVAVP